MEEFLNVDPTKKCDIELQSVCNVMHFLMLNAIIFNNGCVSTLLKFSSIIIIAAISWLPPLISQLFSPWIFRATPFFHSLAVFCLDNCLLAKE